MTNVYNRTVINDVTVNEVSYNGGQGGLQAQPRVEELATAREAHIQPTPLQAQHAQTAASNRALFASVNHGRPAVAATPRPAMLTGPGVVPAAHAAAPVRPAGGPGGPGAPGGQRGAFAQEGRAPGGPASATGGRPLGFEGGPPHRPGPQAFQGGPYPGGGYAGGPGAGPHPGYPGGPQGPGPRPHTFAPRPSPPPRVPPHPPQPRPPQPHPPAGGHPQERPQGERR